MKQSIDEWLRSGGYLPEPLKDFHDQKRIFRLVGEMVTRRQAKEENAYDRMLSDLPNWVSAHIYVIDFFLWFMARRGYTLQKSRQSYEFADLQADIADLEKREWEAFRADMEARA